MVAKAPPAKTPVPSAESRSVWTAPSADGAQAASRAPVAAVTAARWLRAVAPIFVNPPPRRSRPEAVSTMASTPPADGAGLKAASRAPVAASRAARPERATPAIEVKNPPA